MVQNKNILNSPGSVMTLRQRRFAQAFVLLGNATQAAVRAGYSPRTACSIGSQMKRHPAVAAAIAALRRGEAIPVAAPRPRPVPPLTPRQLVFVDEYLLHIDATKAAINAGYSPRSAHVIGCYLRKKPQVAAAIEAGRAARSARTGVDGDRIVEALGRIAFSDIRRLFDWDANGIALRASADIADDDLAAIAALTIGPAKNGVARTRVKLHDKKGALDALARYFGLYGRNARGAPDTATAAQADVVPAPEAPKLRLVRAA